MDVFVVFFFCTYYLFLVPFVSHLYLQNNNTRNNMFVKSRFLQPTFLVFSDNSSSVLSTSFLKEGLFKGSWLQQDNIMSYLQR